MAALEADLGSVGATDEIDAGPNLEFDADFGALERAAQGKADQQYGDLVVPAEEPDWKEVVAQATALNERTKDLRILAIEAVARLQLGGIPGFAAVLAETRRLLDLGWDVVHPQLDPEDDNDPTLRANALLRFADPRRVLRTLRDMPLASSVRAGRISWRDISVAIGAIEPEPDAEKPSETTIIGVFRDTDAGKLAVLRDAVASSIAHIAGIGSIFDSKAGYGTGPSLDDLAKLLGEIKRFIDRYAPPPDVAAPEPVEGEEAATDMPQAQTVVTLAQPGGSVTASSIRSITTRAEALHLLDVVMDYYARNEPSSPLPLLIDRARRLAEKNFLDILRDLAPDGLGQAERIAGERTD